MTQDKFPECIYRINYKTEVERIANFRSLMAKLDAEGWKSEVKWNEKNISGRDVVFLRCYGDRSYEIYAHDCDYEKKSFPMYEWPQPTQTQPQ